MKRFNNAFTLTELLVALGVIGILCAILLPIIFNLLPNQNTLMAKRAYYIVQTVVADLINDEACYPDKTSASDQGERRVGFDDEYGYSNCILYGGNEETGTITSGGNANKKFFKLFTDKLDTVEINNTNYTFKTKDGMNWAMTNMGFNNTNNKNALLVLTVDVNGNDNPNCGNAATSANGNLGTSVCAANRTNGWDVFSMGIYADGRITINSADKWAINAVKVNKDITNDTAD